MRSAALATLTLLLGAAAATAPNDAARWLGPVEGSAGAASSCGGVITSCFCAGTHAGVAEIDIDDAARGVSIRATTIDEPDPGHPKRVPPASTCTMIRESPSGACAWNDEGGVTCEWTEDRSPLSPRVDSMTLAADGSWSFRAVICPDWLDHCWAEWSWDGALVRVDQA